jgi:uncharacterized membrane protein
VFCQHCGAQNADISTFCTSCGRPFDQPGAAGGAPQAPEAIPFAPPPTVNVKIGEWIGEGWRIVSADLVNFAIMALLFVVVSGAVPVILQGAMVCGMHVVVMKKMLGHKTEFGDLFKGFNWFVPSLVAALVISIFAFIGFVLCIVPGLVVMAMFQFTYLFILDRKMEFWPAMQASHEIVKKNYVSFTLFILALACIQIVGVLACFVGILITLPIQYAAITAAYRETVGFASDPNTF